MPSIGRGELPSATICPAIVPSPPAICRIYGRCKRGFRCSELRLDTVTSHEGYSRRDRCHGPYAHASETAASQYGTKQMKTSFQTVFRSDISTPKLGIKGATLLLRGLALATSAAAQAQFDYTVTNQTITIGRYTGTNPVVIIPSAINDLPVTSIGTAAFFGSFIQSVTIPDSVTSII